MSTSKSKQTPTPLYVRLREGAGMLGISKENFYYYVRTEQIRKIGRAHV